MKRPLQKPSSGNHKDKKRVVRKECKKVGAVEGLKGLESVVLDIYIYSLKLGCYNLHPRIPVYSIFFGV